MVLLADVVDDKRFFKRKFGGKSQGLSPDLMENYNMCNADGDYLMFLKDHMSNSCDPPQELSVENGDDPDYILFLSRLKKDGSSYILEADEKIGLSKSFKYEEEEEDESGDLGQEDMNSLSETLWTVSVDEDSVDEDYAFFCKNTKLSGSNFIFQHESGQIIYNAQNEPNFQVDNTASCKKQMSKLPLNKEKSSCREHSCGPHRKKRRKSCSKFRSKIMKILSKPYDKEEHQRLLGEIKLQKAQHKHLDLRSGKVRFIASNKIGKSYLDYHGDLKRKVNAAAKDDCKQLNLLRGFFFWIEKITIAYWESYEVLDFCNSITCCVLYGWMVVKNQCLKNLTQEGSFIPWNDEECLAMRPGIC